MTNKQKFLDKIDELIRLADQLLTGPRGNSDMGPYPLNTSLVYEFLSSGSTFVENIYGQTSPFSVHFKKTVEQGYIESFQAGKGILTGVRKHIEQDWLESTKNKLSAEIFGDYLEMAEYLNGDGFYIAAAVIAGSTLEERLKQLCIKFSLPIEAPDRSGAMKPIKADGLNSTLSQFNADGKNDVKQVTRNYGLRNDAAHGVWNSDTPQQKQHRTQVVDLMI